MATGLEFKGLSEYSGQIERAIKHFPDKADMELKTLGQALKKKSISRTPSSNQEYKYKLVKSYKLSSVKFSRKGTSYITLSNASPHFHLVEKGHRLVTKDGREIGFVPGVHMLENSVTELDAEMPGLLDSWASDLLGDLK